MLVITGPNGGGKSSCKGTDGDFRRGQMMDRSCWMGKILLSYDINHSGPTPDRLCIQQPPRFKWNDGRQVVFLAAGRNRPSLNAARCSVE